MGASLEGRVFLTGGTGSLGQALLRRAQTEGWGCCFTVFSRDEVKQGQLRWIHPKHRFILGDVRSEYTRLAMLMEGHDLVIHAAAYKQVPAAEVNALEAIETNVQGSVKVGLAAITAKVPRVIAISTDKACAPINCYGMSKALMEKALAQLATYSRTVFTCVRYGNVLGSRGSIEPLFRQQRAAGGPLTVTDPEMTRFWLTLDTAVDLVLDAVSNDLSGAVLVPKCPASTVQVLVEAVAPGLPVEIIGTRPGEKKHEQLVNAGEAMHTDERQEDFRIWPAYLGYKGNLPEGYEYRSNTARQLSVEELREML